MRIFLTAMTAFILFVTPVMAGNLEEAKAALQEGDYEKALQLLQLLAEQGEELAQWYNGLMYDEGKGVPKKSHKAIYWKFCKVINSARRS